MRPDDNSKTPPEGEWGPERELRFSSFKSDKKIDKKPSGGIKPVAYPVSPLIAGTGGTHNSHNGGGNVFEGQLAPNPYGAIPAYESSYTNVEDEDEKIDIRDFLGVILHRRYWLLVGLVLVIIVGFITKVNRNPIYKSVSRLRVINMTGVMDPFYGHDYVSDNTVSTHKENLKSLKFLENVALKLDTNIKAGALAGLFKVDRTKEANILNVIVKTPSPDFSPRLANVIAEEYDAYDLKIKQKAFSDYEAWILGQMQAKQTVLDSLESRIKEFYESNPIFYTKGEDNNLSIRNYDEELTNNNLSIHEMNKTLALINQELKTIKPEIITDVNYETPLKKELLTLNLEMAKLSTKYNDGHPKMLALKDKIIAIKDLIRTNEKNGSATTTLEPNPKWNSKLAHREDTEMKRELLLSKREKLLALQEEAIGNLAMAPELEKKLNQLARNKATTEKMYFTLQEKLQDTQLRKSATPREIFMMDGAGSRGRMVPHKYINFWSSLLIGLIFGIGICFVVEYMDSTVQKSKDVENKYGIRLLGLIPKESEEDENLALSAQNENALILPHFEPYRRLLENLFPTSHTSHKSVLVTSALQGEGKTTTAANLATTAALKGERVLIIDADLRRHNLHNLFQMENEYGISEFLSGHKTLPEIIQSTGIPNLSIICAGRDPLSLTQSPSKNKLKELISVANANFDLVVFDSPPILQLVDTLTLAPMVLKTLVVFRSKKTPVKAGEEVLRQLHHIKANVAGGVLNDVSRSFWDQYYYQYYKYGYTYNYK